MFDDVFHQNMDDEKNEEAHGIPGRAKKEMTIEENRFRLRLENKIVGFKKQIHQSIFYSKDQYAWNGKEIQYTIEDKFTGFFDNNRRAIYAEDIIEFTKNNNIKYALVHFDEILENFQIFDLSNDQLLDDSWFDFLKNNPFVFKSYNFIQPNL